ncbi:MAG: isoprenyl transferase [Rhizobiales bacterium]|nr:isoprenyl transferase [Hyphomicrobiales bacterium]
MTLHRAVGALPRHVAIIMDGNGRWARARGLPRTEGHRRGVESVRRTVRASMELGIKYLTIFSFSSENWNRPQSEIVDLMDLLRHFIRRDLASLHENGVRIRVIGARHNLDADILALIEEAERTTAGNSVLHLTVAFNYGARDEIVETARRLAERVAAGELTPGEIDAACFEGELATRELAPLDLMIRTSGEVRISNFLLWQVAYAELVFVDVLWPDFDKEWLEVAIRQYAQRERRFGGLATGAEE